MGLIDTLRSYVGLPESQRSDPALNFQDYVNYFNFNNNLYGYGLQTTMPSEHVEVAGNFEGLVAGAYKSNGIVWACMLARMMLFSEARFQFRQMVNGQPGDLFGTKDLGVLEKPWPRATTGDLLARVIQDADMAGTSFTARLRQDRLTRLRPDWVTMVHGGEGDSEIDADLLGLLYHPGGRHSGQEPIVIDASNVATFAPIPDPTSKTRGLSWMSAVIPEIQADSSATRYKTKFFDNGATVNLVVQTGVADEQKLLEWVRRFRQAHEGSENAGKTLFLTPGADAKAIGANMQEMQYSTVQGAGETRVINASGMHAVIVGTSEGMSGSTLNEGNFKAAKRLVADKTLRPLWRNFAGSIAYIVPPPPGADMWYDDRHIPFLSEDIKDAAEVQKSQAETINRLITAGYMPDSVIDAVMAGDWKRLRGKHSGLYSVQLQPPMPEQSEPEPTLLLPNGNGNGVAKPAVPEA